ncbi:MAG: WD40/YVTN/BNR-like repeat-containing protein, partial [Bryobacteraceae bacterium]
MLTDNLRDRWRHYRRRRNDATGADRPDIWYTNTLRLLRMKEVTREEVPAPPGAPAPTRFVGVSWVGIGPQPLRIDAEQNFQGSGPDSGEVVDILIDPGGASDQTILIATNNGGVWKSVDGGASWQTRTDFMPSLSMGALAMDPVDHQIVYVGTGNNFDGGAQQLRGAGIYRSLDAGDTWLQVAAAQFVGSEIVRMVIPAPNVLIVATNKGLFRSIDG